ncbi:MAG: DUF1570 domain-containing protein, partial [Planctomycetes bacterium]|nr:DUF1570 domain-containing protein [Planctomycetota bacterium]
RDDDDERRPVGVAPRPAVASAARPLLLRLYDCFHKKDMSGVLALLKQLEEHGEVPEVFAARGLLHFHAREYRPALDTLTRAGDVTLQAVHDRAFAALYLGRLDLVRELLDHEALKDDTRLRLIVEGPFRQRYERAADVLEGRSDDGHYRVITDLGLSRAELAQLEQRLGGEADAGKRLEQVERARRRHRGLDELGKVMEKAYKAYDKLFGPDRPGEVVPTVIVFSDRGQFETFSARLRVGSTENTLGYYWPPYRILVFYDQDEGQRRGGGLVSKSTLETLLHETFHQWLDLYVEDAPRWFDEGLAEYFGLSELGRTELRYGLVPQAPPSRLHDIKLAFAGEYPRPLPLQRLLTADHATFMRGTQAGINYAHAWSFVHYLGSSTGGQKLLREYFKALREGLDREKAFDRVFAPLDLDRMEADWRQYVGRLR